MQNKTPITDAAMQELEIRKKALGDYNKQMMALFTEKVKSAFDRAIVEIEFKQNELLKSSSDALLQNTIIINPEELTGEQTGNSNNAK